VVFRHGVVETSTVLGEMFNAGLFFQCPSHVGNPSDEDERLAAELDQDSCKKDPPEKKTQWEHLAEIEDRVVRRREGKPFPSDTGDQGGSQTRHRLACNGDVVAFKVGRQPIFNATFGPQPAIH
jgi:hypothetical protein